MDNRLKSPGEQKLKLLYIISQMGALEQPELERFILENNLLDYMDTRLYLSDLLEDGLLCTIAGKQGDLYLITPQGEESLQYFLSMIPFSTREIVKDLSAQWRLRFRKERQVFAGYEESPFGYHVRLYMLEESAQMMDINLEVADKAQAQAICARWEKDAAGGYMGVVAALLEE